MHYIESVVRNCLLGATGTGIFHGKSLKFWQWKMHIKSSPQLAYGCRINSQWIYQTICLLLTEMCFQSFGTSSEPCCIRPSCCLVQHTVSDSGQPSSLGSAQARHESSSSFLLSFPCIWCSKTSCFLNMVVLLEVPSLNLSKPSKPVAAPTLCKSEFNRSGVHDLQIFLTAAYCQYISSGDFPLSLHVLLL